jgi:seryl-tRNA synthetase
MFELKIALKSAPMAEAAKELLELVRYLHEKVIDARLEAAVLSINLEDALGVDVEVLSKDVSELVVSINKAHVKDFDETLYSSTRVPAMRENPWGQLVNSGLIIEIEPGICYLSGALTELLECADLLFRNYAASLGVTFQTYPSIIPLSAFIANGYLSSFPQHAFFVASAHQSLSALQSLARIKVPTSSLEKEVLGAVGYMLAPTVCYHCFEALRGSTLHSETLFSARSICHRNEVQLPGSLLRLRTFNMREIIFYGDASFVEATREQVLTYCVALVERLELTYRVQTASDPFFASGAGQQRVFQKLSRSKLELQLFVPYNESWVSVASFNHHASTLTAKYSIGPAGLNSGCFGVGYERLLYAAIAQLGCDIQDITRKLQAGA